MTPKLYGVIASPPVRAVLICAKAIELELNFIEVDLMSGEHLKPEFVKINPLHTVPVLDDNGFILIDSHAILAYLVDSYAKEKSLYPADLKKRARVNQLLHFDSGTLFTRHVRTAYSIILQTVTAVSEENNTALNEAYGFIETFLQNNEYIAGDALSIADLSAFTTISNASIFVPVEEGRYLKLRTWQRTLEALPCTSINKTGRDAFENIVRSAWKK